MSIAGLESRCRAITCFHSNRMLPLGAENLDLLMNTPRTRLRKVDLFHGDLRGSLSAPISLSANLSRSPSQTWLFVLRRDRLHRTLAPEGYRHLHCPRLSTSTMRWSRTSMPQRCKCVFLSSMPLLDILRLAPFLTVLSLSELILHFNLFPRFTILAIIRRMSPI